MSETSSAKSSTTAKPWPKEQNWIKDVLSKSGTELVQLSPNKAIKITKKFTKQNEKHSQNTTMVYYPSTPLIIKSEQPSQAQMCAPLRNLHESQNSTTHLQQPSSNSSYIINNVNITSMQQHQHHNQQQQQQQISRNINSNSITTATNNHYHQQQQHQHQQQYLTNIKRELLPPGITLYATTQPASLTAQQTAATPARSPTSTASHNVASTAPTSAISGRKNNGNKPQFKCDQCGMTFGSKSAHTSHTKSHAKNGELSLKGGGGNSNINVAPNSPALVAGLEVNEAITSLGIPKTPQIKPNATAVTNGGDPYQCNVCQKTFAVPARLIRHYRTHTGERPFECEFCHKLFSVKENLQVHRRIHTKERPYKCDVCGRAFEHSGKLHRHMRIHTGERPHKCSVCDKTFIQSGQLVIHMRTHTGEKPYKCPVEGCGKGFTCSKQLKVHSRTHTGEKPYHCDICFRDFGYNHVLKLHRVQHYGSKCYKCTICDETFKSKKEMEAHIKGHANEMPDDDEETNVNGNAAVSSITISWSAETNSAPNSPQSPSSSVGGGSAATTSTRTAAGTAAKPRKQRKEKYQQSSSQSVGPLSPGSPGSPTLSSMSPSSSYNSGSRLSAASPTSPASSPTMSLSLEVDHHSRDSGVASGSIPCNNNTHQLAAASLVDLSYPGDGFPTSDEMPTDLTVTQNHHIHEELKLPQQQNNLQHTPQHHLSYHHYQSNSHQSSQLQQQYHYLNNNSTMSPSPVTELQHQHQHVRYEQQQQQPTINPALLEAATIASRREDDVQQAAIQIMQLHHSQQKSNSHQVYNDLQQQQQNPSNNMHHNSTPQHQSPQVDDVVKSMVRNNLTENIVEHYKRDELTRHVVGGLNKGYAPVPKFEPSLQDNEIILRQVEAAIAPLRSSTDSPDRASSPESDMMLMADRDVMTLPLRKRKLYMSDRNESSENIAVNINTHAAKDLNHKVMRHSSVIQFAKAS